jgi:leucyl aminopeptidase
MIDLPDFLPLRITRSAGRITRREIDALDQLLAIVPDSRASTTVPDLPKAPLLRRLLGRATSAGQHSATTCLENARGTALTLARVKTGDTFSLLTQARKLVAECGRNGASRIGAVIAGFSPEQREAVEAALIRAADAAAFDLASFKSEPAAGQRRLRSLKLFGQKPLLSLERQRRGNRGNNLARWLTALPPNKLTALSYRAATQALAREYGLKYEFLDIARLKRRGAGAFLAVAQGNATADAGIVHLSYRPSRQPKPALALVGKGIIFDTGGTNLKTFLQMLDMHMDMQGSAVALGTAVELAAAGVPFGFDVWLAISENRISATSYKSQDVVVAANGTAIQVIHTDAEGRMVLADTLTLASEPGPSLIIDYATLTGACVAALTTRYSGIFSNRPGAVRSLLAAGVDSGERVWPFPLDDDYDEPLKSDVADVRQCLVEGGGDHIYATRFLKRFVPDSIAWIHIDLSAGMHKGGLGAIPSDVSGFGVAYTLELLADRNPAELAKSWS